MTYEQLLTCYELALDLVKMQRERGHKSPDFLDGFQKGALQMYWSARDETDFKPQIDPATPEEKKKFYDPESKEEPFGILRYRGQEVPVYDDDYGQQEYIIFRGETYCGGAYNFGADYDFCSYVDNVLDNDIREITKKDR